MARSEFKMLQNQINPHFLFNTEHDPSFACGESDKARRPC
ncbi:MAG: histidine kinase [Merdibacter sp.]